MSCGLSWFGSYVQRIRRIPQYSAQFAQEGHASRRSLHQYAAAVERIGLSAHKIELREPVESTRDRRLRNPQFSR